ncbi:MAG: pantetheine-phosphate adenylyltransferase [Ruminococcaceae bacterium]|nr:pantetheine-phosphate adenylyltransferase [Oscillospiraceae bacterium]
MKKIAVCPGSYDPVTRGHADLARRAAKLFGACRVVVMNNRDKKYLFSLEERFELCKAAFSADENITVDWFEGMLYEYLGTLEEPVLVKGVRNETDFLYEKNMARFNLEHSGVETLYLDASESFATLSSTQVREKIAKKEDLSRDLPQEVLKLLRNKM